jgi:hypothetical protein
VSREYWGRLSVQDHRPERTEAIVAAVSAWQDEMGVSMPAYASPLQDDALLLDLSFTVATGWTIASAVKSLVFAVGQANGGPCRAAWTGWCLANRGQMYLEWASPRTTDEPGVMRDDQDEAGNRRNYMFQMSVEWAKSEPPTEEAVRDALAAWSYPLIPQSWLFSPEGLYLGGLVNLGRGVALRVAARQWLAQIEAVAGPCEFVLDAWNLDHPEFVFSFNPEHFPVQEPQRELMAQDWVSNNLPPFGRCGYCFSDQETRLLGTWKPDEANDRWAAWRGSQLQPPYRVMVCASCEQKLRERLARTQALKTGLLESDGNPAGWLRVNPELACMTCGRTVDEAALVINHATSLWVCRECLLAPTVAATSGKPRRLNKRPRRTIIKSRSPRRVAS